MAGVPYNSKALRIPHDKGCVVTEEGEAIKGLFVAGWAKRGPVGIIDATLRDSLETFRMVRQHMESGLLDCHRRSNEKTLHKLNKNFVTAAEWGKVMDKEDHIGMIKGKPREKFLWTEDYERIIGKSL
mmetsp:Transcript_11570/g.13140  ORF Transcript_11570/g.13140 Transcript_11570/m.13140 type:complete len:128 (-) Transcript_11570:6-389(-)